MNNSKRIIRYYRWVSLMVLVTQYNRSQVRVVNQIIWVVDQIQVGIHLVNSKMREKVKLI